MNKDPKASHVGKTQELYNQKQKNESQEQGGAT